MPGSAPDNPNWRSDVLARLEAGESLSQACRHADVSQQTIYRHRQLDPELDREIRQHIKSRRGRPRRGWRAWMSHYIELLADGHTRHSAAEQLGLTDDAVVGARGRYADFDDMVAKLLKQPPAQRKRPRMPRNQAQIELGEFRSTQGYDLLIRTLRRELSNIDFRRVAEAITRVCAD
jgi:hypothetical protein